MVCMLSYQISESWAENLRIIVKPFKKIAADIFILSVGAIYRHIHRKISEIFYKNLIYPKKSTFLCFSQL